MANDSINDAVILTVNGKDYPIEYIEVYHGRFASPGFARTTTVIASTKRNSAVDATGRAADPVTHIPYLKCTEFYPVDSKLTNRVITLQGKQVKQVFVDLYSIDGTRGYALIVVEDLKN